ncbi:PAS domain-containing protein [Dongia sp.]|uniref:PAS domain-containing protein n=1 Tax=Dongia sp. TaxID=1977262 RepID=UPI0037524767
MSNDASTIIFARPALGSDAAARWIYDDVTEAEVVRRIAASHDSVRSLYAYWRGRSNGCAMPSRGDIDPVDFPRHLPSVTLVDVVPDQRRFVYRLVGTQEVAGRGGDPTGQAVGDAYYGESREAALGSYEYVVRSCRPFCVRDPYTTADGWEEQEDTLYLPLSADRTNVNMVLVYTHSATFRPRLISKLLQA